MCVCVCGYCVRVRALLPTSFLFFYIFLPSMQKSLDVLPMAATDTSLLSAEDINSGVQLFSPRIERNCLPFHTPKEYVVSRSHAHTFSTR